MRARVHLFWAAPRLRARPPNERRPVRASGAPAVVQLHSLARSLALQFPGQHKHTRPAGLPLWLACGRDLGANVAKQSGHRGPLECQCVWQLDASWPAGRTNLAIIHFAARPAGRLERRLEVAWKSGEDVEFETIGGRAEANRVTATTTTDVDAGAPPPPRLQS